MQFDAKYRKTLIKLGLEPVMMKRYVDDKNMAARATPKGMVLQKKENGDLELVIDVLKARSKGEKEREKDDRTANLYGEVANTVRPKSIVMEVDFPSAHSSGRIPILNMEVWVSKEQESSRQEEGSKEQEQGSKEQVVSCISFNFYAKPMASKDVIYERSAFTTRVTTREKKNILLEEASRRLRNCSPHNTWESKAVHLTSLNLAMMRCGHRFEFRSMITCRAVSKYMNSLRNHLTGKKVMYRDRLEMVQQWEKEGGKPTKTDWFQKGGGPQVSSMYQLLRTPGWPVLYNMYSVQYLDPRAP